MAWDREKDYLSPLAKAVMANLEKCFAGDKAAYDAIVVGFSDTHRSDEPLSESDMKWAKEVAAKFAAGEPQYRAPSFDERVAAGGCATCGGEGSPNSHRPSCPVVIAKIKGQ